MDWTHRLRLRNVKMLLSLAQTRNISHSAAMLNTTQPGLSKWLKDLEEDIGLPLFERHTRGLIPTHYGEVLIEHARRLEAQLDRASHDMEALREGSAGRVVIGASGAAASDTAPLAILRLLDRMPQAHVSLVEGTTDRLLEQLAQGNLDLAMGRTAPERIDPSIESESLYMDPIQLVARPRHPLFSRQQLTWADLQQYRWIVWPQGTPVRTALDRALAEAGESLPRDAVETNSVTSNLTLLNNSDMIGVASHRAALRLSQMNTLRILPVRLSGFGGVALYWRQESFRAQAVQVAMDCIREVVAGHAALGT
jgi:DNA-binding transcriptional LysR family regulator